MLGLGLAHDRARDQSACFGPSEPINGRPVASWKRVERKIAARPTDRTIWGQGEEGNKNQIDTLIEQPPMGCERLSGRESLSGSLPEIKAHLWQPRDGAGGERSALV